MIQVEINERRRHRHSVRAVTASSTTAVTVPATPHANEGARMVEDDDDWWESKYDVLK